MAFALLAQAAAAGPLNVTFGVADATQRQAFTALVDDFKAANADVDLRLTLVDLASYRKALPAALEADAPDVFNWFAGEQMRSFAQRALLEDLGDLWKSGTWSNTYSSTQAAASWNDRPFALPYQHYTWGLFLRRDVLVAAGVREAPRDLGALLTACSRLQRAKVTPLALGAKDGWALAAWFDYIDLRTNGGAEHLKLTDGRRSYADPGVRRSFMMWKQLVDAGCFAKDAIATDAASAQAQFAQGRAGMMLMGTVASAAFPDAVRSQIEFARFPLIDAGLPFAEAAPTDTFHIAMRARNKADARRFLRFAATSAANGKLARAMGSFPTNKFAPVAGTVIDLNAFRVLTDARGGLVQSWERDTPGEMAVQGIKAMQDFLVQPQRLDEVLARLESARLANYHAGAVADAAPAARPPKR